MIIDQIDGNAIRNHSIDIDGLKSIDLLYGPDNARKSFDRASLRASLCGASQYIWRQAKLEQMFPCRYLLYGATRTERGVLSAIGGIYALLLDRQIVYVGFSSDILTRIHRHICLQEALDRPFNGIWFMSGYNPNDARFESPDFAMHPNGDKIMRLNYECRPQTAWTSFERILIAKLLPEYNFRLNRYSIDPSPLMECVS